MPDQFERPFKQIVVPLHLKVLAAISEVKLPFERHQDDKIAASGVILQWYSPPLCLRGRSHGCR